jgi:hypothetical protein
MASVFSEKSVILESKIWNSKYEFHASGHQGPYTKRSKGAKRPEKSTSACEKILDFSATATLLFTLDASLCRSSYEKRGWRRAEYGVFRSLQAAGSHMLFLPAGLLAVRGITLHPG